MTLVLTLAPFPPLQGMGYIEGSSNLPVPLDKLSIVGLICSVLTSLGAAPLISVSPSPKANMAQIRCQAGRRLWMLRTCLVKTTRVLLTQRYLGKRLLIGKCNRTGKSPRSSREENTKEIKTFKNICVYQGSTNIGPKRTHASQRPDRNL